MSEWIKCSERMPEEKKGILMVASRARIGRTMYTTDQYAGWFSGNAWNRWPHEFPPTHWMPLPELPK